MSYGVMDQNSFTGVLSPEVKLVSSSSYPLGTLFNVWHGSRHNDYYHPKDIEEILGGTEDPRLLKISKDLAETYKMDSGQDAIKDVISTVISMDLPATESIQFTFQIDNASIALREQLVRHRQAGLWVQTSRTMDLRTMDISMSPTVELFGGSEAVEVYEECAQTIRDTYSKLMALGVPPEDIRLKPDSSVHRMYVFVTLRTLKHMIGKRTSWIAQATLWTDVLAQVFSELDNIGLYEYLGKLVTSSNGATLGETSWGTPMITKYDFDMDARARYVGEDPLPVDPLYLAYHKYTMPDHTDLKHYDYMKSMFIQLWSDEYLEILGWDRSDPSILGPYDRPD